MTKLEKLYSIIENSRDVGVKLTEDVLKQVEELEENIIKEEILPALSSDIAPRLEPIKRDLVLVVEYHPGDPISVALSRKAKISEIIDAKTLTPRNINLVNSGGLDDDNTVEGEPEESTEKVSRAGSIGFSVKFKDGTVIRYRETKDTLIESLRKIGLERVSRFRGRLFKGYPLVGKIKRIDGTHRWQEKVGDWYIYINISNDTKIRLLEMLSSELHLDLVIERDDEPFLPLNAISGEIKTDKVKRPYNPEAELVVEFPDGTIFDDKKAIWTFVRAIEKIGFEKVAKVGIEIQGYNLVDKRQRTDKGRTWQKQVGPYYVYSYLSNGDKIKYLNRIATHYGLDLKIVAQ